MKTYQSYVFKDKDPVIDQLRTVMQDVTGDRALKRKTLRKVELQGGPTVGCMEGWFDGKTKRPQNATVEAAGRALGMMRVWVSTANVKQLPRSERIMPKLARRRAAN